MKKYQFLLKPVFFIINLLLATWLVLIVENIYPSDFSRYKSLFLPAKRAEVTVQAKEFSADIKTEIMRSGSDYKKGAIDSIEFGQQIEKLLNEGNRFQE